jgi:hypothetical protein
VVQEDEQRRLLLQADLVGGALQAQVHDLEAISRISLGRNLRR